MTPTNACIQPCTSHLNGTITSCAVNVRRVLDALIALPEVELAVRFRHRVDVVQRVVAVADLERLARPYAEDVRA